MSQALFRNSPNTFIVMSIEMSGNKDPTLKEIILSSSFEVQDFDFPIKFQQLLVDIIAIN